VQSWTLAWSEFVVDVAEETEYEIEEMSEQVLKGREDPVSLLVGRRREQKDVGDDGLWE